MKSILLCIACVTLIAADGALHWPTFVTPPHPAAETVPHATPVSFGAERLAAKRARVGLIARGLAQEDLARWRRGWFKGGDPGKYLPLAAIARLLLDPADATAIAYMNDDRSAKEHYHFACLNWARYLPLYGHTLTRETRDLFNTHAWRHGSYHSGEGTENHKLMWYGASLVIPHYIDGKGLGRMSKEAILKRQMTWLKQYVRKLYRTGMGEWESATYHMFSAHSLMNVYDFSPDPEARAWAAAGLEYYIGALALKWRDGSLAGPSQRGMSARALSSITDCSAWLWWGSNKTVTSEQAKGWRYALQAGTANWQPSVVLCNIAEKNLPDLPVTYENSKANYWFGLNIPAVGNVLQETLRLGRSHTLGSLWSGWDKHGQTVRWQLTCSTPDGAIGLTGGHPWGDRTTQGLGRYEQTAQFDDTLVLLYREPSEADLTATSTKAFERALAKGEVLRRLEKDPEHGDHPKEILTTKTVTEEDRRTWVGAKVAAEQANLRSCINIPVPPELRLVQQNAWWSGRLGDTLIAFYPLGADAALTSSNPSAKERKRAKKAGREPQGVPVWQVATGRGGFVLQVADATTVADAATWAAGLAKPAFDGEAMAVSWTTPAGAPLSVRYRTDAATAAARCGDQVFAPTERQVFAGPHFTVGGTTLTAWDGTQGYRIDLAGESPVWTNYQP